MQQMAAKLFLLLKKKVYIFELQFFHWSVNFLVSPHISMRGVLF